jgi:cation diffusion facilitator CzcD-associated flavoprotein CzcO
VRSFEKRLYRAVPAAQKLIRGGVYAGRETFVLGFVKQPRIMKVAELISRAHMRRQVTKPGLLERVTPDYTIGCKRILPSNKWYPALSRPNVELVEGGVERVTPNGVVGADGVEREVDAIIFGTGFEVTDMPVGKQVRGRDGRTLEESWDGSPRTYLGTSAPGFPNLFLLLGPNTGLGHSSMVYMIESQVEHVVGAVKAMDAHGAETVEVRPATVDGFNAEVDARHEGAVWNTGCRSWYLDDTGRNATLWPDWTFRFRQRTREFDPAEYELAARRPAREAVPA